MFELISKIKVERYVGHDTTVLNHINHR